MTFSVVIPDMDSGALAPVGRNLGNIALPASRPARAPAQSRTTTGEKTDAAPPFPDNVYSLKTFRETRPKKTISGGYDISGTIRPWPSASPVKRMPEETEPPPAPPEENRQAKEILLEEPAQRKTRAGTGASDVDSFVPPGEPKILELSFSDRPRFQPGFVTAASAYKRVTDIALVYLLLMILGGCGYLLIHSVSREIFYLLLLVLGGSAYLLVYFLTRMMN